MMRRMTAGEPRRQFGFDAVDRSNRRKPFPARSVAEDAELTADQRNRLRAGPRDLFRNFELCGWMVRRHLDSVARFGFRANSGDDARDEFLERKVDEWSSADRCDATGRLTLAKLVRIVETLKLLSGDVLVVKLATGHLQLIEADRIKNPPGKPDQPNLGAKATVDGVELDPNGRAIAYHVWKRTAVGMEYDRRVPAENAWHLAFIHRYDQVRGFTPMTASLNRQRDTYECFEYAVAKAKLAQIFGVAIYSNDPETDDDANHDFTKGPVQLELEAGEKAEFLESKNPSAEFQSFIPMVIGVALKALDIPFSFFDEAYTNYSGQRQGLLTYEESCKVKRQDLIDFLNAWLRWRLTLAQLDGELEGHAPEEFAWVWQSIGIPWIDPLKEREADVVAVESAMGSRQQLLQRRGDDFWQILDELAEEEAAIADAGLSSKVSYQPAPTIVQSPDDAEQDDPQPTNTKQQRRPWRHRRTTRYQ